MGLMVKGLHHRKPNLQSQLDAAVFSNCTSDPRAPSEICFTRSLALAPSNAGFARSLAPLSPLRRGPLGQSPLPSHQAPRNHVDHSVPLCRPAVSPRPRSALANESQPGRSKTSHNKAHTKAHCVRRGRYMRQCEPPQGSVVSSKLEHTCQCRTRHMHARRWELKDATPKSCDAHTNFMAKCKAAYNATHAGSNTQAATLSIHVSVEPDTRMCDCGK